MAPQRAVLKFSWTSRTRNNLLFLLQVFDFTRQSIEVIEHARFQITTVESQSLELSFFRTSG